jgi:hypothetical protein
MNNMPRNLDFSPRKPMMNTHEPALATVAANPAWRLKLLLPALALALLTAHPCMAQTNSWPDDLISIATNDVPTVVYAWWSLENWNLWPPSPANCAPGYPLYYSPSDPNTNRVIYIDDRESGGSFHADDDPLLPPGSGGDGGGGDGDGGGGGGDTPSPLSFGTNLCLFLSHPDSNWNAILTISNTIEGTPYEILVSPAVTNALPAWLSAGVWAGAEGNTTPVPVELPTNAACFFDARIWNLSDYLTRPGDGQLLLLPSSTNAIHAMINGVSNTFVPFASGGTNYVLLDTPLYSVNLGYDGSDSGPSNTTTYATWPNQGIMGVIGFSETLTNFCLSYNPLTNIDVHGFTALQDLECWHCTNLLAANVTNCPALQRVCLEACDLRGTLYLSGDTNLEQLRAASQASELMHNIVFGGAGPLIWHLCAHDNQITNNLNFTQFPSLKEFWFWRADQSGSLAVSSTNLTSVQLYTSFDETPVNAFTNADFHGQLGLTNLQIAFMYSLTNLNIAGCSNLVYIDAESNGLPTDVIDSVLTNLDAMGAYTGYLNLYGTNNQWPSPAGLIAVTNLLAKYWAVEWNGPPLDIPQITDIASAPGSNTATITWHTQIPSDSTVYYGLTTSYGSSASGNSNLDHTVTLTGLITNTQYHYYVTSTNGTNFGQSGDNTLLTLGAPPNTNAIIFVSTSQSITGQIALNASATLTWLWGDGTSNSTPSHTFSTAGTYTNYLIVNPVSALTGFGVACQGSSINTLASVSGLSNYPNLEGLYFYESQLSQISLAGCTNLVYAALALTSVSSDEEDAWFNDLADAQAALTTLSGTQVFCTDTTHTFYYPASPGPTSASATARSFLESIHWTLSPH